MKSDYFKMGYYDVVGIFFLWVLNFLNKLRSVNV